MRFSSVGTTALSPSNPPRNTSVTTTSGTSVVDAANEYLTPVAESIVIPPKSDTPCRN